MGGSHLAAELDHACFRLVQGQTFLGGFGGVGVLPCSDFSSFDGCFKSRDSACVGQAVNHLGRQDTIGGSVGSGDRRGDLRWKRWQGMESGGSPRWPVLTASNLESQLSKGILFYCKGNCSAAEGGSLCQDWQEIRSLYFIVLQLKVH